MARDSFQQAVREVEAAGSSIVQPRKETDAGLWETDLETGETVLDESLERLYGIDPGSFDGSLEAWEEFVHPEDRASVREAWERTVEHGEPYQIIYRIVREDGTVRWIDSRARLITDENGEPVKMQGLNADITQRRERLQALQVLDRVLRHNLRNDMTVIKGHAELIEEAGSGDVVEHAETIRAEADQLLETAEKQRTIGDLLTSDSAVESVDLVPMIEDVADALDAEYPDARITLDLPAEAPVTAVDAVDEGVRELLQNAIVHNDRATPTVEVRVDVNGEGVTLRVADDGPGIPAVERDLVTGNQKIGPLQHASGLGLWLISWAIERSGGTITFDENEPRGTVVTVEF